MDDLGVPAPREAFLDVLSQAKSNLPDMGTGADVYRKFVEPLRVTPRRVAAHLAISSLVEEGDETAAAAGCEFRRTGFQKQQHGRLTLATSRLESRETITGRTHDFAFAGVYLGGVDFHSVLRDFPGVLKFEASAARIWGSFRTASLPMILRIAEDEMGPEEFGLESLLPDGHERISELV